MAEMPPDDIRFYRASERPFGCFSNLYRRPMRFEGILFSTAEAAYQWGKPRDPRVRDWLLAAPKPHLLAMAAHGLLPWDIAPGWSQGRYARMRAVVEAKFKQHPDLAEVLLSTGDARIVECGTVDNEVNRRWGEVNGKGRNWLGIILMEVREALRKDGSIEIERSESMPGPVSDSYDPEFGTGANAYDVTVGIREVVGKVDGWLGPQLRNIVAVAQGEQGNVFTLELTERQLRLMRFGLLRALETI